MSHRIAVAVVASTLAVALAGCTPDPAPSPSPTGFASDADAFAAAEATYRAYVDAGNAYREDPQSRPKPEVFLTGRALELEIESERDFTNDGVDLLGPISVVHTEATEASSSRATLQICIDVSATRLTDRRGQDVTPATRQDVLALDVTFLWTPSGPLIAETKASSARC